MIGVRWLPFTVVADNQSAAPGHGTDPLGDPVSSRVVPLLQLGRIGDRRVLPAQPFDGSGELPEQVVR